MEDPSAELTDALHDSYAIEREIGRGGMATVYLARDLKHGRVVALKVLHPELTASLSRERFRREVVFAARLQHPHILTVLDSGEAGGRLWFTMSYVEGESLRQRLLRERQLPLSDALLITHQVATALDFAHRHGVIHRDVKPENILLIGEDALVTDFGIARALAEGAGFAATNTITSPGAAVGTAAYMSPEQASAETYLDGRTDLYALACVVYEMLAGEPPFTGPTVQAVIAKRFLGDVPSVRKLRPAVGDGVDAAIKRALAPVRADRFRTPCEFYEALAEAYRTAMQPGRPATEEKPAAVPDAPVQSPIARVSEAAVAAQGYSPRVGGSAAAAVPVASATMGAQHTRRWWLKYARRPSAQQIATGAAAVALIVALFAVGWHQLMRMAEARVLPAAAVTSPKRIAVLPFDNRGDSGDAYFAEGVTDAVRGKLTSLPALQVTARTSSVQYRGTLKTPRQIGQELGVDYILSGTVRWERGAGSESRVQVRPELIQVATNSARWEQPFDAALTDVFLVQGEIAGQVAQALNVALGASERAALAQRPTASLAAYDAYLKGQDISNSLGVTDPPTLRRAIDYYRAAVTLDSDFALAWSQLSRAESIIYLNGTPSPAQARVAETAARRALALSPNGAAGHIAMGNYYLALARNADALREFDLGNRAAPGNAELLSQTARAEQSLGRYDDALAHLQQARDLDPRSVATTRGLGRMLLWLRRYSEAMDVTQRGLDIAPTNLALLENKVMIHLARGDLTRARATLDATPAGVSHAAFGAYLSAYWDVGWALNDADQRIVLALKPSAYDDDVGQWANSLAQIYAVRHEPARARAYADTACAAYEAQLRTSPSDGQRHVLYGVALALAGRAQEAVREGQRGMMLLPPARDAYRGPYTQHQMARIYMLVGQPGRALDMLEPLLTMPYYLSPSWLRIDPNFAPLRAEPRFRRLLARS